MSDHLVDLALSDHLDGRLPLKERDACVMHLAECKDCTERIATFDAIRGEARLLRDRPMNAPREWPRIAALTIYRGEVRRAVLRSLWRPLLLVMLAAFVAGAVVTEAVRELSRLVAAGSNEANDRAAEVVGKGLKSLTPR